VSATAEGHPPVELSPAALNTVAHLVVESIDDPIIDPSDHHHVTRVLRARAGELLTFTDGAGRWRVGHVPAEWTDPSLRCEGLGPIHVSLVEPVGCVAVALVKGDKPETIVQKLTELGISRIVLLIAERSVVRWDEAKVAKQLARLRSIAREALMQSRGVWLPTVSGVFDLRSFLAAEQGAGKRVLVAQFGGMAEVMSGDTLVVGPEGGWSATELSLFTNRVSLGGTILRAETAAIVAGTRLMLSAPTFFHVSTHVPSDSSH
jgi:16S rRNA (uracil1498-N3)-methyltransferase